jgi:hypothetical protein
MSLVKSHDHSRHRRKSWRLPGTRFAAPEHSARWALLLVVLIAALLRLAALPELPLGLHYDEAANLILSRQIAEDGYRPLFIRAYTGKEVLFFYAVAPWVAMTGGRVWGLRLGAAMLGVLTVAATFAAVRALFKPRMGAEQLALFAAGWMALAFPHVLLSRYGFRAISQPLLQALTVAALWRGLRGHKPLRHNLPHLVLGGICLGLTGYTYLAARLFPIPLALAFGWLLLRAAPAERQRYAGRLLIAGATATVVFAPLGLLYLRQPALFTTRMSQVVAPSLREAARGIALCLQALLWPGRGDPYVRFNVPGRAVMGTVSGLLALVGLAGMVRARRSDGLEGAGRLLVGVGVLVMILPSALATGEITPSNLRLVGIYPFLAVLPAWGLLELMKLLPRLRAPLFLALLAAGAVMTGSAYQTWAGSATLFRVADGEMVLAAQALDTLQQAPVPPTVYIASEHHRHPTVAALAAHYLDAKWLTGGASVVLPPSGDAAYLIPESLSPPLPWPTELTGVWRSTVMGGPDDIPALTVHTLPGAEVATLREMVRSERGSADLAHGSADFAHVVLLHSAEPGRACRVAEPCPILLSWEPLAAYAALQPIVRLVHPDTGEWDRTMPFHYAPADWTEGDLVLDQLVVTPPVGTPPGAGYEISVGFYDPDQKLLLPRLRDEAFAGLEARYPQTGAGFVVEPMAAVPTAGQLARACPGVRTGMPAAFEGLTLLGWTVTPGGRLLPGSEVTVRLCWYASAAAPPAKNIRLQLDREAQMLYSGEPAAGYGFDRWREGEVVHGVYRLRLPRLLPAGIYHLELHVDDGAALTLQTFDVQPLTRIFEAPALSHVVNARFADSTGDKVQLLGYDLVQANSAGTWTVTLYWQALDEMDEDYVVFLHARDPLDGTALAQTDQMPQIGAYPTSLWSAGEVVTDVHTLVFGDREPMESVLYVGFYLPQPGTHLIVQEASRLRLNGLVPAPD